MKVPRICMNEGCLFVLAPKALKYGEDAEENKKLDVIDMQTRCPKCNTKVTQYVHKVWDHVKDNEEICKAFGVVSGDSKKVAEAKQLTYKAAKQKTEDDFTERVKQAQRRG
jgi:hypothetical protein